MKASLAWLIQHIDLSGLTTAEISNLLTFTGVEVEGIDEIGADLGDLVVAAEILTSERHPDADRLSVCQVDDGSGPGSPRQIVCGAKNYVVGDKVPLALPGARLPGGIKIKKGKLRGVESHGMLCGPDEVGAAADDDGLWILPKETATGTPIGQLIERDTVFDLEVTPNRPDCLSHLGLARELAAVADRPLKSAPVYTDTTPATPADPDGVTIESSERCPFYSVRKIAGVKVGPSPDWLCRRLLSIGLRPINNIVDVTNYVLFEMGHPLHAFDAATLDGGIVVRPAGEGEDFRALDGEDYSLTPDDLVIADGGGKALALAGVMGSEGSGVSEKTVDVLLESAYFTPPGVRRTARRLNLGSDSSYRFERGVDPAQALGASELATRLILEIAGGSADDSVDTAGAIPSSPQPVALDLSHCQQVIGLPLEASVVDGILGRLGLSKSDGGNSWDIPSYRLDLERPIDLIEEVARVFGLENVPSRAGSFAAMESLADRSYDLTLKLKARLVSKGFFEAQTIKLIAASQLGDVLAADRDSTPEPVPLKNPLSDDHTLMRPSLLPGLLASATRNVRMGARSLKLFETGTVFCLQDGMAIESRHLGVFVAGPTVPEHWSEDLERASDVFDLGGILSSLAPGSPVSVEPEEHPTFALAATISLAGVPVGRLAQLSPARARELDLPSPAVAAELDLSKIEDVTSGQTRKFAALPRFPAVTRDVALEVPAEFPNAGIANFLSQVEEPLLKAFRVFDVFTDPTGEKLAADRKSVAYSLTYRHAEKTLKTEEVDAAHEGVVRKLTKALPATVR